MFREDEGCSGVMPTGRAARWARLCSLPVLTMVAAGCSKGCAAQKGPVPEARGVSEVSITAPAALTDTSKTGQPPHKGVKATLDCRAQTKSISPHIYGIGFDITGHSNWKEPRQWELGVSARRLGGNAATRYNWELGTAFNHGSDWIFANNGMPGGEAFYVTFMRQNDEKNAVSAVTIPIMGWVAKDMTSTSFPLAKYPQQKVTDGSRGAGNGIKPDGTEIPSPPPTETSVAASPEFEGRWVKTMAAMAKSQKTKRDRIYILDNEPALWNSTHRDVHPEPMSYDELMQRTKAYATAVRDNDPEALIAGPSSFGWPEYFFSAKDAKAGFQNKPDRRAHDDLPLLAWYLRELRAHEKKTGKRLLDLLDVHFYPQNESIGVGTMGAVDPKTVGVRLRSPRALWDPTYKDESWIGEPVRLLPRLQDWINEYYPGTGIQIGEWNYGAEGDMSSGLATAETLGLFASHGVRSAFYWPYPAIDSPAFFAFRAFRNFDGQGGRFLDQLIPTPHAEGLSVWASKDTTGKHLVLVVLNYDATAWIAPKVELGGCTAIESNAAYVYTAGAKNFVKTQLQVDGSTLTGDLPPYSMTTLDIRLK
ncbi:MAG: glycoside hydrolase family 44 protein [Polyangiaceae bacterium]